MINEGLLEALLEGRVKLRRDIKLNYGKYRMVRRYIRRAWRVAVRVRVRLVNENAGRWA